MLKDKIWVKYVVLGFAIDEKINRTIVVYFDQLCCALQTLVEIVFILFSDASYILTISLQLQNKRH